MHQVEKPIHNVWTHVEGQFLFVKPFSLLRSQFWATQRLPEEQTCQSIWRQLSGTLAVHVRPIFLDDPLGARWII